MKIFSIILKYMVIISKYSYIKIININYFLIQKLQFREPEQNLVKNC